MSPIPLPPWFRALGFALGGLALATWLSVFFHDAKRPASPQQRADLLAASNYAALSLFAPLPASAPHWEQLMVLQSPTNQGRYPIARETAALTLALTGGSPRLAGVLAFAGAALALGWLLGLRPGARFGTDALIAGLALLAIAHGRAWQMTDPFPFLVLSFSALALGAWIELHRVPPKKTTALLLGAGLAGLLLSAQALFVCFMIGMAVDLILRRSQRPPSRAPGFSFAIVIVAALPLVATFAAFAIRNQQVVGSPWQSPAAYYSEHYTSAPVWFWDGIRPPPAKLDPVMERYDELVLIPQSPWKNPVYKVWVERLVSGAHHAGGVVWAGLALIILLTLGSGRVKLPALLLAGVAALTLLYYPANFSWWPLATAPLVWLIACGRDAIATNPLMPRYVAAASVLQVLVIGWAPQSKPSGAEYFFRERMEEIAKKVQETPGKHLIFVSLDDSSDGRLEAADLRRDWDAYTILHARDLEPAQNADLVASMPGRTPWRIVVFGNRIGLQRWTPPAPPSPPSVPSTPEPSPALNPDPAPGQAG